MGDRTGSNIQITGVKQTVAALRAFTPDLYARMNAEIKDSLGDTREAAKARYPKGSWSLRLNQRKLLGSIVASPGVRDDKKWSNSSPGVKAAIFEFIGSTYAGNDPQVLGLIGSLNARYGQPGRFLWDAWDETGDNVMRNIRESVRTAEQKLQARLNAAGEAY